MVSFINAPTLVDLPLDQVHRSPEWTSSASVRTVLHTLVLETHATLSKSDTHHFLGIGRGDQEETVSTTSDSINLAAHDCRYR